MYLSFFNLLNSLDGNIEFTMEKLFGTLSFLAIKLTVKDHDLDSWIWRKLTNIVVFLYCKALYPLK